MAHKFLLTPLDKTESDRLRKKLRMKKKYAILHAGFCGQHDHARSHPAGAHLPAPRCTPRGVRFRKLVLAGGQLRVEDFGPLSRFRPTPLPRLYALNLLVP